jgi:hypothetical protein
MLRKETNEQIEQSCRYLSEAGIQLYAEFIFGYADETPDQMWESVELSQRITSNKYASLGTFIFYPFPNTEAQRQTENSGLISEDQRKGIAEGYGSYKSSLQFEQPHKNHALNLASLLPLFDKLPPFFTEKILWRIYKWPSGRLVKVTGIISTLLLANTWFLKHNFFNFMHMLFRVFTRPKFLQKPSKSILAQVLSFLELGTKIR